MINNKQIGVGLVIIGIIIISITFFAKAKEDFYIEELTELQGGTCILESGYCLHSDRNWTGYIFAWVIGALSLIFGTYLWFFDKSFNTFKKQQEEFKKEVKQAKRKDEFSAYLAGFSEEEQKIIKVVNEQEGITQSTLRFKTGIGKASLSLILNDLEKRNIISRNHKGKTKEVFLRRRF